MEVLYKMKRTSQFDIKIEKDQNLEKEEDNH
jgi:hypothetical protein